MPVTPTSGTDPEEYPASLSQATHLLPKPPLAAATPPAVDVLPPLPAFGDPQVHELAQQFTAAALEQTGLTASREVDELAERQLLWRLMNVNDDQLFIGGETIPNDVFSQPMRVTLMGYVRELYAHAGIVSPKAVWDLMSERAVKSFFLEGLQRELLLVFESRNGRQMEHLLEGLLKTFRARAISQVIFREASARFDQGEDIDTLIGHIEQLVVEISRQGGKKRRSFAEVVRAVYEQILNPDKSRAGLATGLRDFDKQFGGIKRDRVITIGGYTGSGKTAVLIDLIYRLLFYHKDKIAIKFFSFEMSEERIVQRLFSRAAMVSVKRQDDWWVKVRYDKDDDGNEVEVPLMDPLNEDEVSRIKQAMPFLESMDGVIDVEYGAYSIEEAQHEARRFKMKNKGKHIIILFDHLDLFKKQGGDNRLEFNNIMNGCKDMARSLDATVIPLVQLAKSVESRFNKAEWYRPTSSDIMESVGVEAASDIVLLLWRPSKYFERLPYRNPDLGIYIDEDDDEDSWWDARHRLIAVNVKNRDGASFNDIVFDADMAHSKLYNYNQLRKVDPDLFRQVALGSLFQTESYLTGESGGTQFRGPVVLGVAQPGPPPPPPGGYRPPDEPDPNTLPF